MKDLTNLTNEVRDKNMKDKQSRTTATCALPETKEMIKKISLQTGKKNYAIIAEAMKLYSETNGYNL